MGNDELSAFEFLEEGLEPFSGLNVQVVGRFVKEHDIDAVEADELASQRQFGLFATGEFVDGHFHRVLVKAEAFKDAFSDASHVASTA